MRRLKGLYFIIFLGERRACTKKLHPYGFKFFGSFLWCKLITALLFFNFRRLLKFSLKTLFIYALNRCLKNSWFVRILQIKDLSQKREFGKEVFDYIVTSRFIKTHNLSTEVQNENMVYMDGAAMVTTPNNVTGKQTCQTGSQSKSRPT